MRVDWMQNPPNLSDYEVSKLTPDALRRYNAHRSVAKADRSIRQAIGGLIVCAAVLATVLAIPGALYALVTLNILP